MFGKKTDVLGGIPFKAGTMDGPADYLLNNTLTMPWTLDQYTPNAGEVLASQRNVPFLVVARPTPMQTQVKKQAAPLYFSGGIAYLSDRWNQITGQQGGNGQ